MRTSDAVPGEGSSTLGVAYPFLSARRHNMFMVSETTPTIECGHVRGRDRCAPCTRDFVWHVRRPRRGVRSAVERARRRRADAERR